MRAQRIIRKGESASCKRKIPARTEQIGITLEKEAALTRSIVEVAKLYNIKASIEDITARYITESATERFVNMGENELM